MKIILTFMLFFQGLMSLSAIDYHDYVNYKSIDKDQDFDIDTAELRKWSESYTRMWAYNQSMAEDVFPVGAFALKKVDKDQDGKVTRKELRDFQVLLKPIFDKAYEKFKETYDANDNGRVEKSEVADAFLEHPNYFHYFNQNAKYFLGPMAKELGGQLEEREGRVVRGPEKSLRKKKLDDIYD